MRLSLCVVCMFVCVRVYTCCTLVCALVMVIYVGLLIDMQQMPLPPSIYQRLTSSSTLMNLAQALAYHKMYVAFFNFCAETNLPLLCEKNYIYLFVQMDKLENCTRFYRWVCQLKAQF